jgi:hypothetical protein
VSRGSRTGSVGYRRFASSAEAIRFTIEELSENMQRGTAMEVDDERFDLYEIRALYGYYQYPLTHRADRSSP